MPLPVTRTVTETYTNPVTGAPASGSVVLTPFPLVWTDTEGAQVLTGGGEMTLTAGAFSAAVVCTDADGVEPATGKAWRIEERLDGAPVRIRYFLLPEGDGSPVPVHTVVEADPARVQFTPVEGPPGTPGADGTDGETRAGVTHVTDGAPASGLGIAGDWALDAGARRLYGPKEAGGWTAFSVVPTPTEAGWSRNGFAELAGADLYLTRAEDGFGAGSSWYGTVQATDGLDVTFEVEMSGGTGADGICFALADPATATSFVGGGGGDLGLVGCTSVALALDTGAGSRARVVTTDADSMDTVATYGGALTLRPAPVVVRVQYASGGLSAWVDGVQVFTAVAVAAPATARVGWTGSNGGLTDDHIVRNVVFVARGGIGL